MDKRIRTYLLDLSFLGQGLFSWYQIMDLSNFKQIFYSTNMFRNTSPFLRYMGKSLRGTVYLCIGVVLRNFDNCIFLYRSFWASSIQYCFMKKFSFFSYKLSKFWSSGPLKTYNYVTHKKLIIYCMSQ